MGGLIYVVKDSKYNVGITIPILLLSLRDYITIFANDEIISFILVSLSYLIGCLFFAHYIFNKVNIRDTFLSITIALNIANMFTLESIVISIYALIVSLIVLIVSIRNNGYKGTYYVGLIFSILSLIFTLNYMGDIPISVYLLLIGITVAILTFILIYRYQNKEKVEDVIIEIKNNYCGECGNKIDSKDKFCGNCGNKVGS